MTLSERLPLPSKLGLVAALGSGALLGGAYYFQYVLGYRPCPLCLEQRVAYYVTIPLAAMIMLRLSIGPSRKIITLALLSIAANARRRG